MVGGHVGGTNFELNGAIALNALETHVWSLRKIIIITTLGTRNPAHR